LVDFLRKIKRYFRENRILENIFKSKHSKNVLISYTVLPFLSNKNRHTNAQESRILSKIFDELGFNVDIIHYTNQQKLDYKKYDLIFGFGEPFENSFIEKKLKKIYYATGAHVCHQNYAEIRRIEEVNKKYNTNLLPKRLVPWNWSMSTSLSDSLIVIGNEWTKSTYTKYTTKLVYTINATALINDNVENIKRDVDKSKKNFLWFGSSGLVHKGLDLCLEYFSKHQDLTLHICGPMENDFKENFSEYFEKENIIYHGFTDVQSQKFIDIVSQCSFSLLPTCSEGQATSLLTAMGAGLVPIATRYSGIDVIEHGIVIDELDLKSLATSIEKAIKFENKKLLELPCEMQEYISKNHTLAEFRLNMKSTLSSILHD
jgi:glycosyltransferase involved in cell wall biosynthesis